MDVKALRERRGWSQRELADQLGVSQPLVAQWERGSREVGIEHQLSLASLAKAPAASTRREQYPSAPPGGGPGSREAEERLAWVRARNQMIQGQVAQETSYAAKRVAYGEKG